MADEKVTIFRPHPLAVGQKLRIEGGPRGGDWEVIGVTDRKVRLRCPVSGKEVDRNPGNNSDSADARIDSQYANEDLCGSPPNNGGTDYGSDGGSDGGADSPNQADEETDGGTDGGSDGA